MNNPNPFADFVSFLAKAGERYHEMQINNLMTDLEEFNKRNYKDAAIDVALATGDRVAFEKLVGVNE